MTEPPDRTDLVVVGGGPVGLVTALQARALGLDAVVLESRGGDGDKACGEGLMPSAVRVLQHLGVRPAGQRFRGIRYFGNGAVAESRFAGPPGLGVRRTALIGALRARAAAAGINVVAARVTGLEQTTTGVQAVTDAGRVRASYAAVADGLHSPSRRRLGLDRRSSGPRRYGLRRHFGVPPWSDVVEVYWAGDAEAYVTPTSSDQVGVAILSTGGVGFDVLLESRFPSLRDRLSAAPATTRVLGAGPFGQASRSRRLGRVLLVGDAAGYVDALTGEGLAIGFQSAHALAHCVAEDRPQDYERQWRRITLPQHLLTSALLRASQHPPVRVRIVPTAARFPGAFEWAVRTLT